MATTVRRAAQSLQLTEDDKMLDAMIKQMIKATENAEQTIDDTLDVIAASNQSISRCELLRLNQAIRKNRLLASPTPVRHFIA